MDTFYVSLAAVLLGLLLIGFLAFARDQDPVPDQGRARSPVAQTRAPK